MKRFSYKKAVLFVSLLALLYSPGLSSANGAVFIAIGAQYIAIGAGLLAVAWSIQLEEGLAQLEEEASEQARACLIEGPKLPLQQEISACSKWYDYMEATHYLCLEEAFDSTDSSKNLDCRLVDDVDIKYSCVVQTKTDPVRVQVSSTWWSQACRMYERFLAFDHKGFDWNEY